MANTLDVVVIGGGISGMAVARGLVRAGRSVAVLEGRERLGGRLLTTRRQPALDLGASWFWPGETRVAALVAEFGIATFEQHLTGNALFQTDRGVQVIDGNPIDVPSRRFTNGAIALVDALATAVPSDVVHRNEPALRVVVESEGVTVTTTLAEHSARHVVLALPPALARHTIEFEPHLPDRLDGLISATPVWMGATTKVVARYATPFWRTAGLAGAAFSHVGPMREIHDMSGPDGHPAALFGFVPSAAGSPTPSRTAVLGQLVALFGNAAAEPIDLDIHDWRAEGFTSPPDVERQTAFQLFGHPALQQPTAGGRLHWSSTETATESPGHIEGALQAAERTLASLIAALDHEGSSLA